MERFVTTRNRTNSTEKVKLAIRQLNTTWDLLKFHAAFNCWIAEWRKKFQHVQDFKMDTIYGWWRCPYIFIKLSNH